MKIAIAQLNYHIGNFAANSAKIIDHILKAKKEGADLVVFSELAICGYPPLDFLDFDDFITRCESSMKEVASHCKGIAAIVGGPARNPVSEGKDLFNAAFFLKDGKIASEHHKALLPTYDVFDEYRYFEPGKTFSTIECAGCRIALTICEDLWDIGENLMYTLNPMDELMGNEPQVMVNIAASPFSYSHYQRRELVLKENALRYKMPLFYVNHVGAQTEILFDGGSLVLDKDGLIADRMPFFEESFKIYDTKLPQSARLKPEPIAKEKLIHDALVMGIRDYFQKLGFTKAILGLSGGIDSAIVCVLAVDALGKENVLPLLMPSRFSSDHSISDAEALAKHLGMHYEIIPIEKPYSAFLETLEPHFKERPFDVTEENLQARIRGMMLMAFSNKFGHILLNTSNKSELAVGYGTLYGDMAGGLSVIGDVFKTEVYQLAQYINRDQEIIPWNTIQKPPSAELRPGQKDVDSLPPYDVLDELLYNYIELKKGPSELIAAGFEKNLVERTLRMVNMNEYKRKQFAPILRVSDKAFGLGRRLPIVGKYLS